MVFAIAIPAAGAARADLYKFDERHTMIRFVWNHMVQPDAENEEIALEECIKTLISLLARDLAQKRFRACAEGGSYS